MPGALRPLLAWVWSMSVSDGRPDLSRRPPRRLSLGAFWRLIEEEDAYRARFSEHSTRGDSMPLSARRSHCRRFRMAAYMAGPALSYSMLYNLLGMPAGVVAATRVRAGEEGDCPSSRDVVEQAARARRD